jgi:glutamine amidotransferase
MIAVIDYGAGNLQSVHNALNFIGAQNTIASDSNSIISADAVILPGVGSFGAAMNEMNKRGLADCIKAAARSGKPFLGICAGMQLLFDGSEESPGIPGLCLLPGKVKIFPQDKGLKVPHMGWNSVSRSENSKLLGHLPQDSYMYFVHSYYVSADKRADVSATTEYAVKFDSAVEKANLFGCQFHPEKSGELGLSIYRRFAELAKETK